MKFGLGISIGWTNRNIPSVRGDSFISKLEEILFSNSSFKVSYHVYVVPYYV